jgi:TolA-binding protein
MSAHIPTDDSVIEADELDASLFWHAHKQKILLGIVALVVIVVGGVSWYVSSTLTAKAASAALAEAKDIPQLEAVVKKFGGTPPASDALLLLAAAQQAAGKFDESTASFQDFLKANPKHQLAGGALFGIGQNQDAAGKPADALTTYQQVVEKYPKSYAAPFAAYSQAEILLRDFRRDEARAALEALISQFPDSPLARLGNSQLVRLAPKAANP